MNFQKIFKNYSSPRPQGKPDNQEIQKQNGINDMNVELKNVDEIRPYEKNPRINDGAVDAVVKSIKEFGFRQPIVVDADGVLS